MLRSQTGSISMIALYALMASLVIGTFILAGMNGRPR